MANKNQEKWRPSEDIPPLLGDLKCLLASRYQVKFLGCVHSPELSLPRFICLTQRPPGLGNPFPMIDFMSAIFWCAESAQGQHLPLPSESTCHAGLLTVLWLLSPTSRGPLSFSASVRWQRDLRSRTRSRGHTLYNVYIFTMILC